MKVTVKFTQGILALTGKDQTVINLRENAHLSDLLEVLTMQYGKGLMDLIYASELEPIDTWASIIVDGKVMSLDSDVMLKEDSIVVFLVAASGG